MKIKITDLENKLNCKIKRNCNSIGFDTATKTGVGVIKTTKTYVNIEWSLIHFQSDDIREIYKQMYWEFGNFISKDFDICVIEDVFVSLNPDTTIKLARFGGLVMAHTIENQIHFECIKAVSARAKLKINTRSYKGKPKKAVADWLKNNLELELDEDNCADGVVLALLGIIEGLDFKPKTVKKKRKRNVSTRKR